MADEDFSTSGAYVTGGADFTRDTNYIETRVTRDGRDGYPVEPGRYRLIAARACPWANRTIIVRRLLGLESAISMGLCGPTHDVRSWTFDLDPGGVDPVLGYERLQQAYFARFPDYPRGNTLQRCGPKLLPGPGERRLVRNRLVQLAQGPDQVLRDIVVGVLLEQRQREHEVDHEPARQGTGLGIQPTTHGQHLVHQLRNDPLGEQPEPDFIG